MLLHWSRTTQSIVFLLHHSILPLVSIHVLCWDRAFKCDLIKRTTSVVNCISIIKSRNTQNSYLNTLIIQSFTSITFPTPGQIIASCHPLRVKEKKLRKLTLCCFIGLEILAQPHHVCRLRYLIYFLVHFLVIEWSLSYICILQCSFEPGKTLL